MSKPVNGYVVYLCERLRDGREEGAKCFDKLEEALEFINKIKNGFAGCNHDVALYELGKKIEIEEVKEEEPQPAIAKSTYRVKKDTRITKMKGLE